MFKVVNILSLFSPLEKDLVTQDPCWPFHHFYSSNDLNVRIYLKSTLSMKKHLNGFIGTMYDYCSI